MKKLTNKEMAKSLKVELIKINDQDFISIKDFSKLTGRSNMTLFWLIREGNKIRKLKNLKLTGRHYIPFEEIFDFPFAKHGKHRNDGNDIRIERFYFEKGHLKNREEIYFSKDF